jgi:hypothetical protein
LPAIDYSKSVQQVFIEAARYIVLERQDLLLWSTGRPPCGKRIKGLPSWVPDFSTAVKNSMESPQQGLRMWWDGLQPRKHIRVSDDNGLMIQVYALDRVEHISRIFDAGNASRLCFEEYKKLPALEPSETIEERDTRFWRTLVLNSGGPAATMWDTSPPPAELGASFCSLIANETMMEILGCTPHEFLHPSTELQARVRESPELLALLSQCGRGVPFEDLLIQITAGRRFFRTENGRFGMTAVEDIACVDPSLRDVEDSIQSSDGRGGSVLGNMGKMLADPMTRDIMGRFQEFLAQKNPGIAKTYEQAMRGELQGQQDSPISHRGGVAKGDMVVACIGGFVPYILRLRVNPENVKGSATCPTPQLAASNPVFELVGECYLHGAMNGEDFMVDGSPHYRIDVSRIVDVTIV